MREGYDFLLRVQSRLRIVHNRSLDEVPQAAEDVEKLARRLGFEGTEQDTAGGHFLIELDRHTRQVREMFLRLLAREALNSWLFFAVAVVGSPALFLLGKPVYLFERYFLISFVFFLLLLSYLLASLWRCSRRSACATK